MTEERTWGNYGPHVKVVCKPASPPSCDLVVRVRDITQPSGWRDVQRFNDMSDDWAYTNAADCARAQRAKILEGEA